MWMTLLLVILVMHALEALWGTMEVFGFIVFLDLVVELLI
jgi:hypothetical protein